jgi:D-serine deaminase-like pyridoxal phosphate-dependent protein
MEVADWYTITNIDEIDSPALLVYTDHVKKNIETLVKSIDSRDRLRPHVKTHKSAEVTQLMLDAGIRKFKCATIAEAEMLADVGAPDILLAYQPIGPKAKRLAELVEEFSGSSFSCLIDNFTSASFISDTFQKINNRINVFIDMNVGMNRTGIIPESVPDLYTDCKKLEGIKIIGLHAYDGHLRDVDYEIRKSKSDACFAGVQKAAELILKSSGDSLVIVAGGTPTYSIHCKRKDVECSPGTLIYWDKGYEQALQEQHYRFAAVVVTRVVSKPSDGLICIDLGHKAIASENPLPNRVYFLNAPELIPAGHSEEHMVLQTSGKQYNIGDVLYGVPYHVCPTVALHDQVHVVENKIAKDVWSTLSRNRKITI